MRHSIEMDSTSIGTNGTDYIRIPQEVRQKFKTMYRPIDFELEAGLDDQGRLRIVATRKNPETQEDLYDFV